MLAEARARAAADGIRNITLTRGDAQTHPFDRSTGGPVDAATSRYGAMFLADPEAAFGNIGRALRPGARLALVCPSDPELNGWVTAMTSLRGILPVGDFGRPGLPGMFSLAVPDRVRAVLAAAGFTGVTIEECRAYGTWGRDATDAADFLLATGPGRHLMDSAGEPERARARAALTDHLRAHETDDGTVPLLSTAWLVTAERRP